MNTVVILLAIFIPLIAYALVGKALRPLFTKHCYEINHTVKQVNHEGAVRYALEEGFMMTLLWPVELIWVHLKPANKRYMGTSEDRNQARFDNLVKKSAPPLYPDSRRRC